MKNKDEIVRDWLPRYTGRKLEDFGQYVLLVNFSNYVELFAERFGVPVVGRDRPMLSATAENITILSFGMGSAMAATAMKTAAKPIMLCMKATSSGILVISTRWAITVPAAPPTMSAPST